MLYFFAELKRLLELLKRRHEYLQFEDRYNDLQMKYKESLGETKEVREQLRKITNSTGGAELNLKKNDLKIISKKAKENGQITEYLNDLIEKKMLMDKYYYEAICIAAKTYRNENKELRNYVYSLALEGFNIKGFPEFLIRQLTDHGEIELQYATSFSALLTMRARLKQLHSNLPEEILDNKALAYKFIDYLNVKRPWVKSSFTVDDIPIIDNSVIKPFHGAGSRGVYLYFEFNHIRDVKRQNTLKSKQELINKMKQDLIDGWVSEDNWLVEELIIGNSSKNQPAKDYKFYCFYGKVELILEVTRYPNIKYCWWNSKGEHITTGKYQEELYEGEAVNPHDIIMVESISVEIPTPFVRIDFLKSENELIFGEFTPKPGNYDQFNKETDQWLGECYLSAQQRLTDDLIHGKQFHTYTTLMEEFFE
ncbi:teichuronopeptide biosynthesis [Halalkalibacter hemicellulosilyticusJCM 9152]|uniref:Teichuronopeptide biosynthesis n=2 Tax=Halalkalibacter TaxID=2893056 RepID=W4QLL1_9BACI|nr:teichuronopeptide biosynthesis [Halalkalibacter hemicellulosilyticusJCM 9152]